MLKRSITGVFITLFTVGAFLLKIFVSKYFFDAFIFIIAIISNLEMAKAFKNEVSKFTQIIPFVFTTVIFVFLMFLKDYLIEVITLITLLSIIVLTFKNKNGLKEIGYLLLILIYPSTFLLSLVYLNGINNQISLFTLIGIFAVSCVTDVFAYLVGSKIGGKKLCEKLSPNKTISGAIGGLVGGGIVLVLEYAIFKNVYFDVFSNLNTLAVLCCLFLIGVLLACFCEIGDLFESFLKRNLEIKDMGKIFPGHGGMLDRIDGLTFVSLLATILLMII